MSKSDLWLELSSNLNTTGALTFSSKALVTKMISKSDLSHAKVVVELGGGDGSITQGIIERLEADAELLVFEINKSFCDSMKRQFPQSNVRIINDSAENLHKYLHNKKADYIFSSLPFSLISKEATDEIMTQSKNSLTPTGAFIQICYSYLLKNLFKKHFNKVNASFTFKNLPPAFVMVCR